MAAPLAALGGDGSGRAGRRAAHTIAESAVVGMAAAEAAAMPDDWTPTRFFGAWNNKAAKRSGFELFWDNMGHCEGPTPEARMEAIDSILQTTIMRGYKSDDFYEGVLASHNDYAAMQAHAAALVDAFRGDFWAGRRNARTGGGRSRGDARPVDRRAA